MSCFSMRRKGADTEKLGLVLGNASFIRPLIKHGLVLPQPFAPPFARIEVIIISMVVSSQTLDVPFPSSFLSAHKCDV